MGVLNDNIVGGAAGASTGQEIYAPSSNDWDYTYDGSGEWPAAGNSLGDDSDGGYVDNSGGDSALSSLFTFDGDFDIEWTATGLSASAFGVHAIDEDDERGTDQYLRAKSMTNSFSWIHGGTNPKDFFIGSTAQSDTNDFADGSVIKIERRSGTIKVYDDGSEVHSFSTTYTGTMRFWLGAGGAPFSQNYDNILFTDSEGVQRDGFINEGTGTSRGWGGSSTERHFAFGWKPTRTMTVTSTIVDVQSIGTSFDAKARLYTDNAGSPGSLISASDTVTMSSSGNKTFTFTSGDVNKGTWYWMVFSDEDGGSGSGGLNTIGNYGPLFRSGKASAITSITDHASNGDIKCQIIGETTEEPEPDHDTLLLIHSDTTDGSTTFVDSSQFGRTITVGGNAQHDTAQNVLSTASSILLDGTGDYLTVPDSTDWNFGTSAFTLDWHFRSAGITSTQAMVKKGNASTWSGIQWISWIASSKLYFQVSNNGSTGITLTGTTTLSSNTWYHVALVRKANVFTLFLNGTSEVSTTSSLTMLDSSHPVSIGIASDLSSRAFNGHLSEIRISRVARWDANFTPPTSPYP